MLPSVPLPLANEVSVMLSVNFRCPDRSRGDVNRANCVLRRLGLKPAPPGDAMGDRFKRSLLPAIDGFPKARRVLQIRRTARKT